jgi:predicted ester cyclase
MNALYFCIKFSAMDKAKKNRQFIISYYKALSGREKNETQLSRFVSDPKLVDHILFYEMLFPKYELVIEEITCEDDRVIVRERIHGKHTGKAESIEPTFRIVKTSCVKGYRIEHEKIVDYWVIADQMDLLEQLGLTETRE